MYIHKAEGMSTDSFARVWTRWQVRQYMYRCLCMYVYTCIYMHSVYIYIYKTRGMSTDTLCPRTDSLVGASVYVYTTVYACVYIHISA